MKGGVPQLDLNGSAPRIKFREGNWHTGQREPGPKIRVGIIDNEVDLFNLWDSNSHLGSKESPPIGKLGEVFIGLHSFSNQINEA